MPSVKRKSGQDIANSDTQNNEGKVKKPRKSGNAIEETAASSRPSRTSSVKKINGASSAGTRAEKTPAKTKRKPLSIPKQTTASKGRAEKAAKAADREEAPAKTSPPTGTVNRTVSDSVEAIYGRPLSPDTSFWLMKAEPESRFEKGVDVKFSIDDLREAKEPEPWDGVRNPSARNNMRAMKKGDVAFFYHSNCKTPGIAGMMEIVQEHSLDESAFDPAHPYYDPKSKRENPKWVVVHVEFRRKFKTLISLADLKSCGELANMQMLKQSRLSVSAVTPYEAGVIMGMAAVDETE